ncbi:FISUMP domain-containing protein [Fibrobacter succinogenes]|uniref:FISUMP domain-containing protein n=1 Tax=Fibrobacter succinogenes TaxID=833 RepID=UPI0015689DB2|nr:FISUMP domain-containing protein [Fibrobacter succinogenes]
MKFPRRNSLVSDFIGAAFCLFMAFALVMMYAGCSEDVDRSPLARDGGSTEETALLENITVKGLAMVSPRYESLDSTQLEFALGGVRKGSIVTLYELDSLSLDTTGVAYADTIDNDEGLFNIQVEALKSPYVLIAADMGKIVNVNDQGIGYSENNRVFRAVADVRDSAPIVVDVISDLLYARVRFLVKLDVDFVQAMDRAKRELFDAIGVYDVVPDYKDLESLDYYAMLSVIDAIGLRSGVDVFAQRGSFAEYQWLSSKITDKTTELIRVLSIPQAFYDGMGARGARMYQTIKLYEKYLAGILSAMIGVGRCTTSLEGQVLGIPDSIRNMKEFKIVCRSESWHLTFDKHVSHSFGTMTDARDGRTYKTVTIDFGEKTATWMAENLNYNGAMLDTTYCYDDKAENCEIFGRQYDWHTAVGLGKSVLRNWSYVNMDACRDALSDIYMRKDSQPYDSAYVQRCIEHFENTDPLAKEKCESYGYGENVDTVFFNQWITEMCNAYMGPNNWHVYLSNVDLDSIAVSQGVCPGGWRIPTFDDWEEFFKIIEDEWGKIDVGTYLMATPSIEEPFGLGIYNTAKAELDEEYGMRVGVENSTYLFIPTNSERSRRFSLSFIGYTFNIYNVMALSSYYRRMFVRCIKN